MLVGDNTNKGGNDLRVGDKLKLTILRGGSEKDIEMELVRSK